MIYTYPAIFTLEENGQYSVRFQDLEIYTYGNSFEDAMFMAKDLLKTWIISAKQDGLDLPEASISNNQFTHSISVGVGVWATEMDAVWGCTE